MNPRKLAIGPVMLAALCSWGRAADWPTYRHDNARSGVTVEKLAPPLTLHWTFRPTHPPEPAWPHPEREKPRVRFDDAFYTAVASGLVYFGSSAEGKVCALDAEAGRVRWELLTGGAVRLAPSVWEGRVYFASDDGYVYCVSAADGSLLWRTRAALEDRQVIGVSSQYPVDPADSGEGRVCREAWGSARSSRRVRRQGACCHEAPRFSSSARWVMRSAKEGMA